MSHNKRNIRKQLMLLAGLSDSESETEAESGSTDNSLCGAVGGEDLDCNSSADNVNGEATQEWSNSLTYEDIIEFSWDTDELLNEILGVRPNDVAERVTGICQVKTKTPVLEQKCKDLKKRRDEALIKHVTLKMEVVANRIFEPLQASCSYQDVVRVEEEEEVIVENIDEEGYIEVGTEEIDVEEVEDQGTNNSGRGGRRGRGRRGRGRRGRGGKRSKRGRSNM